MNKTQATIWLVAFVALVFVVAIVSVTVVLTDGHPENDAHVATIFTFAAGLSAGVFVIVKLLMGLHDQLNERLTQLLSAARGESRAEGVVQGQADERANPMSPQQSVAIVPDPENPLPVTVVDQSK